MKSFNLPSAPQALIFDLDGTLYTNKAYAHHQEQVLVHRLARHLGVDVAECESRIAAVRESFRMEHDGRNPSLARCFFELGISIEVSVAWRNECITPEAFLRPDPQLRELLQGLAHVHRMALVTNNPSQIAFRSLDSLACQDCFAHVVGLDHSLESKPHPGSFLLALRALEVPASVCVSIGDRFEIDIEPALALGMGGVLVDGVEDVKRLETLLS